MGCPGWDPTAGWTRRSTRPRFSASAGCPKQAARHPPRHRRPRARCDEVESAPLPTTVGHPHTCRWCSQGRATATRIQTRTGSRAQQTLCGWESAGHCSETGPPAGVPPQHMLCDSVSAARFPLVPRKTKGAANYVLRLIWQPSRSQYRDKSAQRCSDPSITSRFHILPEPCSCKRIGLLPSLLPLLRRDRAHAPSNRPSPERQTASTKPPEAGGLGRLCHWRLCHWRLCH